MKKIITLVSLIMITFSCKAQQIVSLEKMIEYRDTQADIPDGTYLKDVNGLLDKYTGTWKGIYDNKNLTCIITKIKHDFLGISVDELRIRYLLTTASGNVIEDTRSLPDTDPLVMQGDYISKSKGYYVLNYFGKNTECGQSGEVYISTSKENKQLQFYLATSQDIINGNKCPTVAEQILPTKPMLLNKQ